MRNLLFYWAIFLGICNHSWGQVVRGAFGRWLLAFGFALMINSANSQMQMAKGQVPTAQNEGEARKCLMKTALSQTHVRERTGRNDGFEIRRYLKILNLPEGTPYCGAFVEWVYRQCGVASNVQAPAVAFNWRRYPHRIVWNKALVIGKKSPQSGDVAVFAWRQTHGGNYKIRYHSELVCEWQADEDVEDFVTVGGNTSAPRGIRGGEGVHKKLRYKDLAVVSNHISPAMNQKPQPLF